ncbi:MAG: GIY-YIG nuclease family protein [Lachnospiraceae bacterium]|nr:GIY-YIG nuclease family protein [Lachnospiraceae bacterium]
MEKIKLNDLLQLTQSQIEKTKFRFMIPSKDINFGPNSDAEDITKQDEINLKHLVHNRAKSISFKKDVIAIGFIQIRKDFWLMTGMVSIIKDNGYGRSASAEYLSKKFNYRLVVRFHKYFQNGIKRAKDIIDDLEVIEVWDSEKSLSEKSFPGYKDVRVGFDELKKKLELSDEWRVALRSRKGIYLISDKSTGKLYVGSAYGTEGILGRWETYVKSGYDRHEVENGKYPNTEFKKLIDREGMTYIKKNFQYTLLETFTDDVSTEFIISRESWWKEVLLSRRFGYNSN